MRFDSGEGTRIGLPAGRGYGRPPRPFLPCRRVDTRMVVREPVLQEVVELQQRFDKQERRPGEVEEQSYFRLHDPE